MIAPAPEAREVIAERSHVGRLLVTRRDPETRQYQCVGFLSQVDGLYRFSYLRSLVNDAAFRPLPGFPEVARVYEGRRLFPVFAERVMSPRRPDLPTVMEALGLALNAEPFEVLARSGGRRVGDTIELVPVPVPNADGAITVDYFVHGVRHMTPEAQARITNLRAAERLRLVAEPDNAVESRAVLVTDTDNLRLGYVPTPLLDLLHDMDNPQATVLRANSPRVGFHFRLLVRMSGSLGAGGSPFTGPEWDTVEDFRDHPAAFA